MAVEEKKTERKTTMMRWNEKKKTRKKYIYIWKKVQNIRSICKLSTGEICVLWEEMIDRS